MTLCPWDVLSRGTFWLGTFFLCTWDLTSADFKEPAMTTVHCTVIAGIQLFIDACLLYNDDSLVADRTGPLPSRNKPLWGSPAGYSAIDWSLLFVHTVQWQILGSLSKKSDPLADQSEAYVWVILPPRTQPTMYGTEGSISPKPYRRVKKISLLIFTPSSILPTSHE